MGCTTSLSSLPLLPLLPLLDDEEAVEPDDDVELSPDAKRDLRERGGVFAASREKGDIVESFAPRGLCTGEMLSARCIFFTGVLHVMWHAGQFGLNRAELLLGPLALTSIFVDSSSVNAFVPPLSLSGILDVRVRTVSALGLVHCRSPADRAGCHGRKSGTAPARNRSARAPAVPDRPR